MEGVVLAKEVRIRIEKQEAKLADLKVKMRAEIRLASDGQQVFITEIIVNP